MQYKITGKEALYDRISDMEEALRVYSEQFNFEPIIENGDKLNKHDKFIVAGMGGSHLPAGIIKASYPMLDLYIHRDYDLPPLPEYFLKESLFIASSYSGNTEETISSAVAALQNGLSLAIITAGGKLLDFAKENEVPYILLPKSEYEPRTLLGITTIAMATMMGIESMVGALHSLAQTLPKSELETEGAKIAEQLVGSTPLIYSSPRFLPIAYNWKIKFNETSKVPAFCNAVSEMNHNELNSFDVGQNFVAIMLRDGDDHHRIQTRMDVMEEMFKGINIPTIFVDLKGDTALQKSFASVVLADWVTCSLARLRGVEPIHTPMILDFKHRMSERE